MTTTKWIMAIIATAITSSYVTSHINQRNQDDLSATPNINNASYLISADTIAVEQQDFIAEENKSNKNNCEPGFEQAAIIQPDTNASNKNKTLPTTEELQFAYEKKQTEIAAFRKFTERTGDSAASVVSNNYDAEPIDLEWARSKEDELLALFNTNETLQNTAPLELSCKSQNCRLILSAHDGVQGESLYSAFKDEALQGSDDNKKQVISYFSNPDSNEIHIYLSKSTFNTLLEERNN